MEIQTVEGWGENQRFVSLTLSNGLEINVVEYEDGFLVRKILGSKIEDVDNKDIVIKPYDSEAIRVY